MLFPSKSYSRWNVKKNLNWVFLNEKNYWIFFYNQRVFFSDIDTKITFLYLCLDFHFELSDESKCYNMASRRFDLVQSVLQSWIFFFMNEKPWGSFDGVRIPTSALWDSLYNEIFLVLQTFALRWRRYGLYFFFSFKDGLIWPNRTNTYINVHRGWHTKSGIVI